MIGQLDLFQQTIIDDLKRLVIVPVGWLRYHGPLAKAIGQYATIWKHIYDLDRHELKAPIAINGRPFGVSGALSGGMNPGYHWFYVHEYLIEASDSLTTRSDRARFSGPHRDLGVNGTLPNQTLVRVGHQYHVIADDYSSYPTPPNSSWLPGIAS